MNQCFVCGKHLQKCDINNEFSREDFAITVRKIIGDDYLLLFGEEDHLCRACQNLLLRIVRLEVEENTNTHAMRVLLQRKYSLDFSNKQSDEPCELFLQSDHDTELCFVCNKLLQSSDFNTDYSRNDLILIIRKIVGDGYFMVIKEEDYLCQACQDLVSTIKSNGAELRTMTLAMRALLRIKYSLEFHSVGTLGSSLEDSPALSIKRPVVSSADSRAASIKRPAMKVCQPKSTAKVDSVKGKKSKKDLTSSNTTPSMANLTPALKKNGTAVSKRKKKSSRVSTSKAVVCNLNSTASSLSEDIEIDSSVEKNSVNENSPATIPKNSDRKKCLRRKVPKPFKCGRCKFKYATPDQLESHNLEMKSRTDYYCKICDFSFHSKHLIGQHNTHHSPVDLKLQCHVCHQPMYDRLHVRYHTYSAHNGEPNHKCSHCNRNFMWKIQLTRHLYKYHIEKPAFTCEKCSKVFRDEVKYLRHVEYFHRTSYSCKVCSKSFKNIDKLCIHEKYHIKATTYKCQYCFKKYRTLENRRLHEEQHSGNFEYKCNKCDLGFNELVWFERHKAKNSCAGTLKDYINRPTMCEICGKIFSSRISFKSHHLLHFNPQPFECDVCFKKYRYKQKLVRHKKRYHPESLASTSANVSVTKNVCTFQGYSCMRQYLVNYF